MNELNLPARIKAMGQALGFSAIGIARAKIDEAGPRLMKWLEQGHHGEMDYMARHADLRTTPEALVPGTSSIICAALDYLPKQESGKTMISRYALGRDYHKVMRGRLQQLAYAIEKEIGYFGYRVFSDSAPVMEVEFAQQAGLGWRGKNSLLLSRHGSWRFLGEIYTDLALPPDLPSQNHCGTCTNCLKACPTQAIIAPYQIDARRCISYLTIEFSGSIPVELRPLIGQRIYGCDDCQLCCPWNRFAATGDTAFTARPDLAEAQLCELFSWNEAEFLQRFSGSPIRRIGHERWLRNLAVALGNSPAHLNNVTALKNRLNHPSILLREHIHWALARQGVAEERELN